MSVKCEELESQARRNNLYIYGVKEQQEKDYYYITLQEDMDLCIERARRSLVMKSKNSKVYYHSIFRLQSEGRVTSKSLENAR